MTYKKRPFTTGEVIGFVLATSPVCLLFAYFGQPGKGRIGWMVSMVIAMTARVRWDLRDRFWFWPVFAVVTGANALFVTLVPWSAGWVPAALLFPIVALDGVAILGILQFLERDNS